MKYRSRDRLKETAATRLRKNIWNELWDAAEGNPAVITLDELLAGMPPSSITHTPEGGIIIDFSKKH